MAYRKKRNLRRGSFANKVYKRGVKRGIRLGRRKRGRY